MLKVRLVVPLSKTLDAPNDFETVGAAATLSVATLLADPVPPLVEVTAVV
jgi:hypothetical protein